MGREERILLCSCSVVIFLILLAVVSSSKTSYQQRTRRIESITSCFLAEYARWRKLDQVVIYQHSTSGKIYFRFKGVNKFAPILNRHAIGVRVSKITGYRLFNISGFPVSI